MILHISQVSENNQFYVKIKRSNDFKDYIWQELIKTIKQFQDNSFKEEKSSTIAAREIAGIPKRKENFAASPLSQPDNRAVEIVIPDLETPGKIAKA